MTFNEERRDRFVLFAARLYLHRLDAIGVEPLIGLAVTTTEAWSQTEQRDPLFPQQAPVVGPRRRVQLANSVGPLVGVDVASASVRELTCCYIRSE